MYQGSNLSRTAQLALNNNESDQINNQLKLLKQKMSSRDTWQSKPMGNDLDVLDSYKQQPFTQPLPQKQFQSQSPLYPRNEFEQYSKPPPYQTKQEAFKSQPQLQQQQDPRQMNFHQMQQYKAQYIMNNNAARSQEPIGTKILDHQFGNYQTSQKSNAFSTNQNNYNNGQYNVNSNYLSNNNYNNNLNNYNNNNYNYNNNANQNYQNNQQNNYYQNAKYQDNNNYNNNNNNNNNNNYNKIQDSYLNKYNQQIIQQPKYPSQQFSNNTQSTNYSNTNYSGDPYLKNTYKDDQQKKYQLYQQQANSVMQQQINYKQQQQPVFQQEINISNQYNSLKHINQNQPMQQQQSQQLTQPQKFYERLSQDETLLKRQQQLQQPFKNEESQQLRKNTNHQQQQQQQYSQPNVPYQNDIDQMPAFVSKNKQPQIPQEIDDGACLIECPEGCGRSFKEEALEKHVKVCQKVFQSKRKEFNSKEARQVTNEQAKLEKLGQAKDKIIQQKKKAKGDPKWKKQSEQFRQMIAAARNGDVVAEQVNDDYVDCPGCGRKFNQNAADKHIPGCRKRNKK